MRMWMVDPAVLCDRHLLGEHVETHMFVGSIQKGISMAGYLANRLLNAKDLASRHTALAQEMERRGMRHKSPLPPVSVDAPSTVDPVANLKELARRCPACRERMK